MNASRYLFVAGALVCLAVASPASPDLLIGVPDMPPSQVDAAGDIREDWGVVGLRLEQPSEARLLGQRYEVSPVPTVVTTLAAGSLTLTGAAYRSPIWPVGVDVLTARLSNSGDGEEQVRLRVVLPEQTDMAGRVALLGGRAVLALLEDRQPVRRERSWGYTGGAVPMPGWATPQGECDPAFRNIRAGLGGVPTIYRFAVPPGAKRTVVLGLCESHWAEAARRPLVLYVEGAPRAEIDPVAVWGHDVPGCLRFDASDLNGDGRLQIVVDPHPQAQDRNTILNVIWVFSPDLYLDTNEVLRGKMSAAAEYYVDAGGEKDQSLYEGGALTYELTLGPRAHEQLTFLVASPGGSVPNPETTVWSAESLRQAAEDVWGDWFARGAQVVVPRLLMQQWRQALAEIMMTRAQADAFFAALSKPGGLEQFSYADAAQIIAALDAAGHPDEAERMLRAYWDRPVPDPLASLAQADGGQWQDPGKDPRAQGCVLQSLARHALLTGDEAWAARAWPTIEAGCEWLKKADAEGLLSAWEKPSAAVGLLGAARVAEVLGLAEAQQLPAQARALDPDAEWSWTEAGNGSAGLPHAAAQLLRLRNALVMERGRELWLLSGLEPAWPAARLLSAEVLPTEFGPISLKLRHARKAWHVTVEFAPRGGVESLVVYGPALDGAMPVGAEVDGRSVELGSDATVRLIPTAGTRRVTFLYQ